MAVHGTNPIEVPATDSYQRGADLMADSFTGNLNLRKPEVGAANDTWGGVAGLNADLDILDAIFLATGLSTVAPPAGNPLAGVPGVGLRIGKGMVLNIEGQAQFKDATDITKVGVFDTSSIATATTRTLKFPDENGTIATQVDVAVRVPTGTVFSGYYGTAPPSFVMADGRTIGDATSGATNRANADTVGLFSLLWNITNNTQCPVSGGRGASAAADYAAHKTLGLPNHSGRVMAGRDDLSGTNQNVLSPALGATSIVRGGVGGNATESAAVTGVGGSIAGSTSGSLSVSTTSFAMDGADGDTRGMQPGGDQATGPAHFHANVRSSGNTSGSLTVGGSFTQAGAGVTSAVTNAQPTIMVDVIIAL